METKTGVAKGRAWACPVTDDELRNQAQRRWRRGDRELTDSEESALGSVFVRRQQVLREIESLDPKRVGAKAAKRVWRMHSRITWLETLVEQAKVAWAEGKIGDEKMRLVMERLCLDLLPMRRLVWWATCAETREVRKAYKAVKPKIAALWDEFWSLGEQSVQAKRGAVGERDPRHLWGDENEHGVYVRDAEGDWDAGEPEDEDKD